MGVTLDFGTTILDGTNSLSVPFDSNGESAVLSFTAESSVEGEGRVSPNPLYVYSDRIRVGLSEAACLSAAWGAGLEDVGEVPSPPVYIQFRRLSGDVGEIDLSDSVGMIASGFESIVVVARAHGVSVSLGTASGRQTQPAAGHGTSVSLGASVGGSVPPAGAGVGHGVSVSYGAASGVQVQPAAGHGVSVSLGASSGTAVAPQLSAPTGLTATPGDASVALSWNAVTNATGYTIERSTASDFSANLVQLASGVSGTSYTNNAANGNAPANGTTYYYRVRATASGYTASDWSSGASATPAAAASVDVYYFDYNPSPDPWAEPDTLKTTFRSTQASGGYAGGIGEVSADVYFSAGGASTSSQSVFNGPHYLTYNLTPTSSFNSITISTATGSKTIAFGKTYSASTPIEVKLYGTFDYYYHPSGVAIVICDNSTYPSKVTVG